MFLAAVDDAAHRFLDRSVLHVDAVDPGKALGPLHRAVDQVVVAAVGLGAERRLVDMHWPVADAAFEAVLVGQRLAGNAIGPVVDHRVFVIDRDPDMPGIDRIAALRARGADLMERQDVMVSADVGLVVAERPDAGVLVAVIGDVDDDARRLGANVGARRVDAAAAGIVL